MKTTTDSTQKDKAHAASNPIAQKQEMEGIFQFVDNRPEAVAQRKLQEMMDNSARAKQLKANQELENNTDFHDNLKAGIESLSSMGTAQLTSWSWVEGAWVKQESEEGEEETPAPNRDGAYDWETIDTAKKGKEEAREEEEETEEQAKIPEQGGMAEDEAADFAQKYGWEQDDTDFTCNDLAHTPKGRVFFNKQAGVYYGADKDGHAGYGFKVWEKGTKKNQLMYQGNLVRRNGEWVHDARGTKPKPQVGKKK